MQDATLHGSLFSFDSSFLSRRAPPGELRPDEFLYPPVQGIRDVDLFLLAQREKVRFAVLTDSLALTARRPEHTAVQIEFHDLSRMSMREEDVLVAAHAQPARRAGMLRLPEVR